MAGLDPGDRLLNVAVSGYKSSDVLLHLQNSVLNAVAPWRPGDKLVYSVMIGANDIHSGIAVATTYANIQNICTQVTAVGLRMVVLTVLPGNPWVDETQRQALNTLIRGGGACPYTLADVGNDPTIGQAGQNSNSTYYYGDGLHPRTTGNAIIGITYLRAALQSLGF